MLNDTTYLNHSYCPVQYLYLCHYTWPLNKTRTNVADLDLKSRKDSTWNARTVCAIIIVSLVNRKKKKKDVLPKRLDGWKLNCRGSKLLDPRCIFYRFVYLILCWKKSSLRVYLYYILESRRCIFNIFIIICRNKVRTICSMSSVLDIILLLGVSKNPSQNNLSAL